MLPLPRTSIRPRILAVTLGVVLTGCEASAPRAGIVARDSAGVHIVENSAPIDRSAPICELGDTPLATLGRDPAGPEYELFRVSSAVFTSDGGIAIVNRGTRSIRLYSESGEFERSVGRAGEGPGEFADPIELAVLKTDSLVVLDWDLMRISILTPAGIFARSAPLTPTLLNPTGHLATLTVDPPFLIAFESIPTTMDLQMRDHHLVLALFDRAGVLTDTVATLPYGQRALVDPATRMMGSPVFVSRGSFASSGHSLYLADGGAPEVRVFTGNAVLRQIIRWTPEDLGVEAADVTAYWERQLQNADAGTRRYIERRRQVLPVAETFPAATGLFADTLGSIWVREYTRPTAESQSWLRFSPEGNLQCTMSLPIGTTILDVSPDRLLIRSRDDLDVEYLQILAHSVP